jgi:hypothetical protein
MDKSKEQIYRQLMWDYNISPEEVDKLVKGETEFAGHYDINSLFVKMLNNLSWYEIIEIFQIDKIKLLLTDEIINKLRFKSIQDNYARLKGLLRNETVSSAKWNSANNEQFTYPILSNRWYGD